MKYDILFKCDKGKYKIEECKKFPTQKEIEETAENLEVLGCGSLKQIIIDIAEL